MNICNIGIVISIYRTPNTFELVDFNNKTPIYPYMKSLFLVTLQIDMPFPL
jgi:hypothetical protein